MDGWGDGLGPDEASRIGTPVGDPEPPVEIQRTIHAFGPFLGRTDRVTGGGPGPEPLVALRCVFAACRESVEKRAIEV